MNTLSILRAWLASIPPARFVTAVTPLVMIAAAWLATMAARYLPGVPGLSDTQIAGFGLTVALFAATQLHNWLIGQRQWEQQVRARRPGVGVGGDPLDHPASTDIDLSDAVPEVDDLDSSQAKAEETREYSRE